jgi:hypothetical protein
MFSVPQRYKTQSCKHPPVQNKSSHRKKFLQKFKSGVTFAPLVYTQVDADARIASIA